MVIDPMDKTVSQNILFSGAWQPVNLKTYQRFVKEGDTILNIGSHVGLEAVVLGKQAGNTGELYIFQPYKISYEIVKKNVYMNGLAPKTKVYPIAASNKKSQAKIFIVYGNTGSSFIGQD